MQTKDIDNAETFQRLVHAIFVAEHGLDFQVPDDRGGDLGDDGYLRSRRMLLAIYCPEVRPTPERRYREKILHDLELARALVTDHGYEVDLWVFVTPEDQREPVHQFVRDQARQRGFVGMCIGEQFLNDRFHRYPHLHDQFPDLAAPQVLERLAWIERGLDQVQALLRATPRAHEAQVGTAGPLPTPSIARVLEHLARDPVEGRRQLDVIWLETQDPKERMLAGYLKAQLADMVSESDSALRVIESTLPLAEQFEDTTVLSVMKALKAWILNQRFVDLDTTGYFYTRAENVVGMPLLPEGLRRDIAGRLHQLRDEADALFGDAARIATEHHAYATLSKVLQMHASALSHRVLLHQMVPELRQQSERNTAVARTLFETSIRIEAGLGNVRGIATAYHNYANDLRMIGSPSEAMGLAQRALEIEETNGLEPEREKTQELLRRLSGGISINAVRLVVAASQGENRFANRFKVHYRPDLVSCRDVDLRDADAIQVLEELRANDLAEPESDDGVHGGLWRLTGRGVEFAQRFRR